MPTTAAAAKSYRERLKANNPEKYQEMLQKAKERSQQNRDAKKHRWATEPQTRGLLQEIENFKEKERKRFQEYYSKKKQDTSRRATRMLTRNGNNVDVDKRQAIKRPRDMTLDERREHDRKLKELQRKRETPKKTWWRRKKDRENKQKKRAEKRALKNNCPGNESSDVHQMICSPVKKSEYNLVSFIRRKLLKKTPLKFARLLKNLAVNTRGKNCHAIHQEVQSAGKQTKNSYKALKEKLASARQKFLPRRNRKKRKDALSVQDKEIIHNFYLQEDISRVIPSKRYATKHGPGYIMQQTLRQAHQLFKVQHPSVKVGYTRFTLLRPKNVRKIGATFFDTCQCVYCLNIRLKILALNRLISKDGSLDNSMKVQGEKGVYKMLLCQKNEGTPFHRPECIEGTCTQCCNRQKSLERHFQPLMDINPNISWSEWVRGNSAREPAVKSGTVVQIVKELLDDVLTLTQQTTFLKHMFTAHWQHYQYRELKGKLRVGQVLVVMDYAENRKSACQDEIKSAHFNKTQFSFHPVVAFYRTQAGGDLVRHAIDFVTDDTIHDFHAVHHFTQNTIRYLKEKGILHAASEMFIFSDNCAAQYKCKGTFADLSQYTEPVQRIYFGAEHGKGEADGETGVVSKAVETAVLCRQVQIRGAADFFRWCQANLTKDSPQSKRHFIFVKLEDIKRDRPESEVKTVAGSRQFHQVLKVSPLTIKSRKLACFCSFCLMGNFGACMNPDYVGIFEVHHIQALDNCCRKELPTTPLLPRKEFFAALQQDLLRSRRSFGIFVECAQDCVRKAHCYPLPFPVLEPEFQKDEVDERAEHQRSQGAVPADHFAKLTLGDGNCLARSLSTAAFGSDAFHRELRVRLACELAIRKNLYLSPDYVARGTSEDGLHLLSIMHASGDFFAVSSLELAYECEVMATVANSRDLGMWHLLAAANVLQSRIMSIYPTENAALHRQCLPEDGTLPHFDLYIQWTSTFDGPINEEWRANHFVPVVKDKHYMQNGNTVQVGDYVLADFESVDGKVETYRAVVISRPVWMPVEDHDVCVKCLRSKEKGRYFVFPNVDDISSIPLNKVRKTQQPTINNRGHYFF